MSKAIAWIGAIFASLGLVFAGVGGWLYLQDRNLAESGVHTHGTVIELVGSRDADDGSYTYRPVVEFRDTEGGRHIFTSRVGSSPPSHSTGDTVQVIYAPGSPQDAVVDSFSDRFLGPLIFGGLGALFIAVGGGLLFAWLRHRALVASLRASGLPIQAKFLECYRDTSVTVNGRSPFRVVCQAIHPGTGTLHSFKSDPIWIDLSERLAGREVRVFVDRDRPELYSVELSPLVDASEMA